MLVLDASAGCRIDTMVLQVALTHALTLLSLGHSCVSTDRAVAAATAAAV